jgi:hypothetical protein
MLVGPVLLFAALYITASTYYIQVVCIQFLHYSRSQDRKGVNYRINTALHHYLCLKDYIYLIGGNHSSHTS